MKKISLILIFIIFLLSGCSNDEVRPNEELKVVVTSFAIYDFTKEIGGEHVDVTLLLPPGSESHSYEPSIQDIKSIQESDLFIFTNDYQEVWVSKTLENLNQETMTILDASTGIVFLENNELENEEGHSHDFDPHIWTSLKNAEKMVNNIKNSLIDIDPTHKDDYELKTSAYLKELQKLDIEFAQLFLKYPDKYMIFGTPVSIHYFLNDYQGKFMSAYPNALEGTDTDLNSLTKIINYISENKVKVVFYQELLPLETVETIVKETGVVSLRFHALHNLSPEDFKLGLSYLDLQKENLQHLKEAFSDEN